MYDHYNTLLRELDFAPPLPNIGTVDLRDEICNTDDKVSRLLSMENFTFINSQFAYYFKEEVPRPDGLHMEIYSYLDPIFDDVPHVESSIPKDPRLNGVPIVQLLSKDHKYRLNLARSRADFFLSNTIDSAMKFEGQKEDFVETAKKIWLYFEEKNLEISWIGFVTVLFLEMKNPAASVSKLLKDMVREISVGETSEVSIRYSSSVSILDTKVSDVLDLQHGTAKFSDSGDPRTGVIITRDYNTRPTEQLNLSSKDIEKFVDECEKNFALEKVFKSL